MSKLTAYPMSDYEVSIRPAPLEREWMDASWKRFAYRCLPINIANTHGWELLCMTGFSAEWDGNRFIDSIKVKSDSDDRPAKSHFGGGLLTFRIPYVFVTDPGIDLYVTGPVNRPKDAIAPLTGIIETDWAESALTMNWIFTRVANVRFEQGEPFCHIFPIERGAIEKVEPEMLPISSAPDLEQRCKAWSKSRMEFLAELKIPGSQAEKQSWQKDYFRTANRSRLRVKEFKK